MLRHAEAVYPMEACGMIAGIAEGDSSIIKAVYFLTNTDHSKTHFSLDAREQFDTVRDMRSKGLIPLGNWHSHPESPAFPSEEDSRLAYDTSAYYLILSLMDSKRPVLHAFRPDGARLRTEPIIIDETPTLSL